MNFHTFYKFPLLPGIDFEVMSLHIHHKYLDKQGLQQSSYQTAREHIDMNIFLTVFGLEEKTTFFTYSSKSNWIFKHRVSPTRVYLGGFIGFSILLLPLIQTTYSMHISNFVFAHCEIKQPDMKFKMIWLYFCVNRISQ